MSHACKHCRDTGSLSKDLYGQLDCTFCPIANEREAFEKLARLLDPNLPRVSAWLIYERGKAAAEGRELAKLRAEAAQYRAMLTGPGYKLVPTKPTPEMLAYAAECTKQIGSDDCLLMERTYRFMLEAAPEVLCKG